MSLNQLLKHVYNQASDDVIKRGKKIFHTSGAQLVEHDILEERAVFRVRNDIYNTTYRVVVNNFISTDKLNTRCPCPYNMGVVCKHEAASIFQLNELLHIGFFDNAKVEYDQSLTVIRMRQIMESHMAMLVNTDIQDYAKMILRSKDSIVVTKSADDQVFAQVTDFRGQTHEVKISQNVERYFDTSCTCDHKQHPLCQHKYALFLHLFNEHGANYFASLRNWDNEKNKLLALYGYSLEDDLRGKFEFAILDGRLSLRVLNPSIKKLSDPSHPENKKAQEDAQNALNDNETFFIHITKDGKNYPFTQFRIATAIINSEQLPIKIQYSSSQAISNLLMVSDEVKNVAAHLSKFPKEELLKALRRDMPFGDMLGTLETDISKNPPPADVHQQIWDYYTPKYAKLLELYKDFKYIYLSRTQEAKSTSQLDYEKVQFSDSKFTIVLNIEPTSKKKSSDISISTKIIINEDVLNTEEVEIVNDALIYYKGVLYTAENTQIAYLLHSYPLHEPKILSHIEWVSYLNDHILKLDNRIQLNFHKSLQNHFEAIEPTYKVYVSEHEDRYIIQPIFEYNGVEKKWLDATPAIIADDGKVSIYERNQASENILLNTIKYLHANMQERRKIQAFAMSMKDVLKKGWYFEFVDEMKEMNVELLGVQKLKQMRINPHKPNTNIQFTTGIDWFSAQVEVEFGDEKVPIKQIYNAIKKNDNLIKLQDGSLGLLSEEFLDKYGLMFKMAELDGEQLKISKIHFSTIQDLDEVKANEEVYSEIEEKKKRLIDYDFEFNKVDLPDNLNATLRPYQQSGFQWMQFLNKTAWGGILADDMGLGKTLQTLTILLHAFHQNNRAKFLVVCPTSLIYNWENECKKFTPDIVYHIYHGAARKKTASLLQTSNLIITTYGTLRSDIEMLSRMDWEYVVLDESQNIKNPLSQSSKAAAQLQAKNKLALSGTPIQNNTFDLFSQMNFLNPGMLGSMDFFKNEFANPIDKMQDENAKKYLKKLIYPFLLRRTKEQVAPDLPPKTESILYCEMGSQQRKVYETYRNQFKSQIMDSINELGIEKSTMSILTGLMKLRQICDAPSILKETEDKASQQSVKLEELMREITENMSNHKALVFSQFLGMLDLIRKELEKNGIPYVYFDGSTSGTERERSIKEFQENEECKVFLISLKAGGVGLNLTAADYVYIVDPWWNPAVEQQAIDRTHRIGQTKNIFAKRMICKDTIEEKIMILQERKLGLAKDLISEDNAFIKKLTVDDVAFLLS